MAEGELSTLTVRIPVKTRAEFSRVCIEQRMRAREAIIALIEGFIDEHNKQQRLPLRKGAKKKC